MKKIRILVFIIFFALVLTGCWSYLEVERFAVVSGVAIDREGDDYLLTTEIVIIKGGENAETCTHVVSMKGKTIFEAARSMIKITGKKLYFGHAQIVIISKEIAEEGITPVLDWIIRDAEPRYTLSIFISLEDTAKSILECEAITQEILSFQIEESLKSSKHLYQSPYLEIWNFVDELSSTSMSTILPNLTIYDNNGTNVANVSGSSIFKNDKLIGTLTGDDVKIVSLIKGKKTTGLYTSKDYPNNLPVDVTLEAFKNKVKINPKILNNQITIEINIRSEVQIAGVLGSYNYFDEEGLKLLKQEFEEMLSLQTKDLIQRVQQQYKVDIFGFGQAIKISNPKYWKEIEPEWEEEFSKLNFEVNVIFDIQSSSLLSKPIKKGK